MAIISSLAKEQAAESIKNLYEEFENEGKEVPEWIGVMAHSPKILKEFKELFGTVMGEGQIEQFLKWEIAYAVSQTLKCPFCVDVTEKMLRKMGGSEEVLQKIKEQKELSEKEKNILSLVREVTEKAQVCTPDLFSKMKAEFTESQIVEIVSIIGLFNYINRFNNTFCILPE
jgi:uncharacterized peroxidase-related enzyme